VIICKEKAVKFELECDECHGRGTYSDWQDREAIECPYCEGKGFYIWDDEDSTPGDGYSIPL
jgi:DnaJ-class molecular chaperone